MPTEAQGEQVARLLADVFRVRIIDVTAGDVVRFLDDVRKHGLHLVRDEAIIR